MSLEEEVNQVFDIAPKLGQVFELLELIASFLIKPFDIIRTEDFGKFYGVLCTMRGVNKKWNEVLSSTRSKMLAVIGFSFHGRSGTVLKQLFISHEGVLRKKGAEGFTKFIGNAGLKHLGGWSASFKKRLEDAKLASMPKWLTDNLIRTGFTSEEFVEAKKKMDNNISKEAKSSQLYYMTLCLIADAFSEMKSTPPRHLLWQLSSYLPKRSYLTGVGMQGPSITTTIGKKSKNKGRDALSTKFNTPEFFCSLYWEALQPKLALKGERLWSYGELAKAEMIWVRLGEIEILEGADGAVVPKSWTRNAAFLNTRCLVSPFFRHETTCVAKTSCVLFVLTKESCDRVSARIESDGGKEVASDLVIEKNHQGPKEIVAYGLGQWGFPAEVVAEYLSAEGVGLSRQLPSEWMMTRGDFLQYSGGDPHLIQAQYSLFDLWVRAELKEALGEQVEAAREGADDDGNEEQHQHHHPKAMDDTATTLMMVRLNTVEEEDRQGMIEEEKGMMEIMFSEDYYPSAVMRNADDKIGLDSHSEKKAEEDDDVEIGSLPSSHADFTVSTMPLQLGSDPNGERKATVLIRKPKDYPDQNPQILILPANAIVVVPGSGEQQAEVSIRTDVDRLSHSWSAQQLNTLYQVAVDSIVSTPYQPCLSFLIQNLKAAAEDL